VQSSKLSRPNTLTSFIETRFRRNSLVRSLVADLVHAFELLDKDDRVRAVVVTAEVTAPAYCSGVSS
jgi:enoyl-CoA hydratase/carnithine racemase